MNNEPDSNAIKRASVSEDPDETMQRRHTTLSDGRYLIFYDFIRATQPVTVIDNEKPADAVMVVEENKEAGV